MAEMIINDQQIVDMILSEMVTHLTLNLQSNVPDDDPARFDVVKRGLILSEKTTKNIQLGIQGGDHEEPDMEDGIFTLQKMPEVGIFYSPREIGGGQTWVRRGVARIEAFFIEQTYAEDRAFRVAYNALGRASKYLETTPVSGLLDSYGERALTIHCYASTFHQSGGPPASYIFRGKIKWVVFTERA